MSEVNKKDKNLGSGIFNSFLWILLLCLLFIPGYFFYISFISEDGSLPTTSEILDSLNKNSPDISEDDWDKESEEERETIYSEDPVPGENFFEKFPVIAQQQAYVAVPMRVDTENPPAIVIYNHGDLEVVQTSIDSDFMTKLRLYAEVFTSNNYIFAASDIHDNEDGDAPVNDIENLISWVSENYTVSEKMFLIGFSRGGYTTTNYALQYPEQISGIALLAPATYYTQWGQEEADKIMNIPIKIWHGTDDVNIQIIHSRNFVEQLAGYDKEIVLLEKDGKAHYDVDDEYIDEILDFFETTLQ